MGIAHHFLTLSSWLSNFTIYQLPLTPSLVPGSSSGQNLTTYLLTHYSDRYHEAITSPSFFQEVLNGTVTAERVAYFFEQDTIYGRGFTSLCGNTLNLLTVNLTAPTSNRTLTAIDNLGQTASGLAEEDRLLTSLRKRLDPGSASQLLCPSTGTRAYVKFMREISSPPHHAFDAFVCSWTMGKTFVDVWTNIQKKQRNKPNELLELQKIIDYWSDPSYVAAIDATGELVDEWYGEGWPRSADQIFLDTLKFEDGFWSSVDNMGES